MKTVNQWAFEAIIGYNGDAATEGFEEMSESELREAIEAQVEHFAEDDLEGDLDTDRVIEAVKATIRADQNSTDHIHAELAYPAFTMTAECQPKTADKWFDGFQEGAEFFAKDQEAANEWLNEQCAAAGTNNDAHYQNHGPYAAEA